MYAKGMTTRDIQELVRELYGVEVSAVSEAEQALDSFAQAWDGKYPTIAKMWRAKWTDIIAVFDFPPAIRKAIYTTDAIESVNSAIRKFTRHRKIYPNEDSAVKLVFMAIREAAKKWIVPIHHASVHRPETEGDGGGFRRQYPPQEKMFLRKPPPSPCRPVNGYIHHWKEALNHFASMFEDRMPMSLSK